MLPAKIPFSNCWGSWLIQVPSTEYRVFATRYSVLSTHHLLEDFELAALDDLHHRRVAGVSLFREREVAQHRGEVLGGLEGVTHLDPVLLQRFRRKIGKVSPLDRVGQYVEACVGLGRELVGHRTVLGLVSVDELLVQVVAGRAVPRRAYDQAL